MVLEEEVSKVKTEIPVQSSITPYKPKNILITGGAGFIGSHVVIRLVHNYPQYNVINT